jgi:hypothetical protein
MLRRCATRQYVLCHAPEAVLEFVGSIIFRVRSRSFGIFHKFRPALFQRRISGTTLWDMYGFGPEEVLPRWRPFLPAISVQLSNLLDSALLKHIDWNIKNLVFNEPTGRLFYVDQKPTIFTADHGNEANLKGIPENFLV